MKLLLKIRYGIQKTISQMKDQTRDGVPIPSLQWVKLNLEEYPTMEEFRSSKVDIAITLAQRAPKSRADALPSTSRKISPQLYTPTKIGALRHHMIEMTLVSCGHRSQP